METLLEEEGLESLRLDEPFMSLQLTPFAAKAAKTTGAVTVRDLATFIFEPGRDLRGVGQGHLEEIRRKIEQFVGAPPYKKEQTIDLSAILRQGLAKIDAIDKSIIVLQCRLQQLVPLSTQEVREAETALLRGKEEKLQKALTNSQERSEETIKNLLERIGRGFVRPWLQARDGIAHKTEILSFLYQKSLVKEYLAVERSWKLCERIIQCPILLPFGLFSIENDLWALSEKDQKIALAILEDAKTLLDPTKKTVNLHDLAAAIRRCRLQEWEEISAQTIEKILFFSKQKSRI